MVDIVWADAAKLDLRRLYQFVVDVNPKAAAKMLSTVLSDVDQLSKFPELGKMWDLPTRERQLVVPFGARAYLVRYRYESEMIFITRIWHGSESLI